MSSSSKDNNNQALLVKQNSHASVHLQDLRASGNLLPEVVNGTKIVTQLRGSLELSKAGNPILSSRRLNAALSQRRLSKASRDSYYSEESCGIASRKGIMKSMNLVQDSKLHLQANRMIQQFEQWTNENSVTSKQQSPQKTHQSPRESDCQSSLLLSPDVTASPNYNYMRHIKNLKENKRTGYPSAFQESLESGSGFPQVVQTTSNFKPSPKDSMPMKQLQIKQQELEPFVDRGRIGDIVVKRTREQSLKYSHNSPFRKKNAAHNKRDHQTSKHYGLPFNTASLRHSVDEQALKGVISDSKNLPNEQLNEKELARQLKYLPASRQQRHLFSNAAVTQSLPHANILDNWPQNLDERKLMEHRRSTVFVRSLKADEQTLIGNKAEESNRLNSKNISHEFQLESIGNMQQNSSTAIQVDFPAVSEKTQQAQNLTNDQQLQLALHEEQAFLNMMDEETYRERSRRSAENHQPTGHLPEKTEPLLETQDKNDLVMEDRAGDHKSRNSYKSVLAPTFQSNKLQKNMDVEMNRIQVFEQQQQTSQEQLQDQQAHYYKSNVVSYQPTSIMQPLLDHTKLANGINHGQRKKRRQQNKKYLNSQSVSSMDNYENRFKQIRQKAQNDQSTTTQKAEDQRKLTSDQSMQYLNSLALFKNKQTLRQQQQSNYRNLNKNSGRYDSQDYNTSNLGSQSSAASLHKLEPMKMDQQAFLELPQVTTMNLQEPQPLSILPQPPLISNRGIIQLKVKSIDQNQQTRIKLVDPNDSTASNNMMNQKPMYTENSDHTLTKKRSDSSHRSPIGTKDEDNSSYNQAMDGFTQVYEVSPIKPSIVYGGEQELKEATKAGAMIATNSESYSQLNKDNQQTNSFYFNEVALPIAVNENLTNIQNKAQNRSQGRAIYSQAQITGKSGKDQHAAFDVYESEGAALTSHQSSLFKLNHKQQNNLKSQVQLNTQNLSDQNLLMVTKQSSSDSMNRSDFLRAQNLRQRAQGTGKLSSKLRSQFPSAYNNSNLHLQTQQPKIILGRNIIKDSKSQIRMVHDARDQSPQTTVNFNRQQQPNAISKQIPMTESKLNSITLGPQGPKTLSYGGNFDKSQYDKKHFTHDMVKVLQRNKAQEQKLRQYYTKKINGSQVVMTELANDTRQTFPDEEREVKMPTFAKSYLVNNTGAQEPIVNIQVNNGQEQKTSSAILPKEIGSSGSIELTRLSHSQLSQNSVSVTRLRKSKDFMADMKQLYDKVRIQETTSKKKKKTAHEIRMPSVLATDEDMKSLRSNLNQESIESPMGSNSKVKSKNNLIISRTRRQKQMVSGNHQEVVGGYIPRRKTLNNAISTRKGSLPKNFNHNDSTNLDQRSNSNSNQQLMTVQDFLKLQEKHSSKDRQISLRLASLPAINPQATFNKSQYATDQLKQNGSRRTSINADESQKYKSGVITKPQKDDMQDPIAQKYGLDFRQQSHVHQAASLGDLWQRRDESAEATIVGDQSLAYQSKNTNSPPAEVRVNINHLQAKYKQASQDVTDAAGSINSAGFTLSNFNVQTSGHGSKRQTGQLIISKDQILGEKSPLADKVETSYMLPLVPTSTLPEQLQIGLLNGKTEESQGLNNTQLLKQQANTSVLQAYVQTKINVHSRSIKDHQASSSNQQQYIGGGQSRPRQTIGSSQNSSVPGTSSRPRHHATNKNSSLELNADMKALLNP